jgi:hypothetical protein
MGEIILGVFGNVNDAAYFPTIEKAGIRETSAQGRT